MKKLAAISLGLLMSLASSLSLAHFQLLWTDEAALNEGQETSLALVFSHPFANGYPMSMGTPNELYVIHDRGEDIPTRTTDLMEYLEPVTWTNSDGEAADAYVAHLPRAVTRSIGDYNFILNPEPYYEAEEDKYIQQITRTSINVGGAPGSWDAPLGCRSRSCHSTNPTPTGSVVFFAAW